MNEPKLGALAVLSKLCGSFLVLMMLLPFIAVGFLVTWGCLKALLK